MIRFLIPGRVDAISLLLIFAATAYVIGPDIAAEWRYYGISSLMRSYLPGWLNILFFNHATTIFHDCNASGNLMSYEDDEFMDLPHNQMHGLLYRHPYPFAIVDETGDGEGLLGAWDAALPYYHSGDLHDQNATAIIIWCLVLAFLSLSWRCWKLRPQIVPINSELGSKQPSEQQLEDQARRFFCNKSRYRKGQTFRKWKRESTNRRQMLDIANRHLSHKRKQAQTRWDAFAKKIVQRWRLKAVKSELQRHQSNSEVSRETERLKLVVADKDNLIKKWKKKFENLDKALKDMGAQMSHKKRANKFVEECNKARGEVSKKDKEIEKLFDRIHALHKHGGVEEVVDEAFKETENLLEELDKTRQELVEANKSIQSEDSLSLARAEAKSHKEDAQLHQTEILCESLRKDLAKERGAKDCLENSLNDVKRKQKMDAQTCSDLSQTIRNLERDKRKSQATIHEQSKEIEDLKRDKKLLDTSLRDCEAHRSAEKERQSEEKGQKDCSKAKQAPEQKVKPSKHKKDDEKAITDAANEDIPESSQAEKEPERRESTSSSGNDIRDDAIAAYSENLSGGSQGKKTHGPEELDFNTATQQASQSTDDLQDKQVPKSEDPDACVQIRNGSKDKERLPDQSPNDTPSNVDIGKSVPLPVGTDGLEDDQAPEPEEVHQGTSTYSNNDQEIQTMPVDDGIFDDVTRIVRPPTTGAESSGKKEFAPPVMHDNDKFADKDRSGLQTRPTDERLFGPITVPVRTPLLPNTDSNEPPGKISRFCKNKIFCKEPACPAAHYSPKAGKYVKIRVQTGVWCSKNKECDERLCDKCHSSPAAGHGRRGIQVKLPPANAGK